jgi:hypothetical protein
VNIWICTLAGAARFSRIVTGAPPETGLGKITGMEEAPDVEVALREIVGLDVGIRVGDEVEVKVG